MKNSAHSSSLEALEPRLAPAGLIAVSVTSAGTLTLATVAGQDGDEVVSIDRLENGSYQLTPGAGVTLRIGGNNYTTPQTLFGITGGLTANLGAGNDSVTLSDCFFSKAVTVNLGAGNNNFNMSDSSLAGTLMVTAGDGNDTVNFSGSAGIAIAGAATFKLGGGQDSLLNSSDRIGFGAGLTFDGGAGDDSLYLGYTDGDDVRVLGNLNFIGGSGHDYLHLGASNATISISGALLFTDTAGNESITMLGARFDAGALQFQVGSGNNTLTSTVTDLSLARNLQWVSTTGADTLSIDGATLRVGTTVDIGIGSGPGSATLEPALVYVGGTLKMSATGTEIVARSLRISSTDVHIGGKLTLSAGAGDGSLGVVGGASIYFGGGAAFSTGAGSSVLGITTNGSLLSNGALSMNVASGNGGTSIFGSYGGDCIINGGLTMKGGDFCSLQMGGMVTGPTVLATSPTPVDTPSLSAITNGSDGLTFAGTFSANLYAAAAGTASMSIYSTIFEGAVTINGGAGAETLYMDNILANKAVNVNLGAGADTFRIQNAGYPGASTYMGAVTLLGGAGADTFFIGRNDANGTVSFRNAVTVDGGTQTDILTLGSFATFAPTYPLKQKNIP